MHPEEEGIKELISKMGNPSKATSLRILTDVFVPLSGGKLACGCDAAYVLESLNAFQASDKIEIAPVNEGVRLRILPTSSDMNAFRMTGIVANHKGPCANDRSLVTLEMMHKDPDTLPRGKYLYENPLIENALAISSGRRKLDRGSLSS